MLDFTDIEFHRQGYGMAADLRDKDPGAPVCFPVSAGGHIMTGVCDCKEGQKKKSCRHFSELVRVVKEIEKKNQGRSMGEIYDQSRWYRISSLISEGDPTPCAGIRASRIRHGYIFATSQTIVLARLLDNSATSIRFLERAGMLPQRNGISSRSDLIRKLTAHLASDEEQRMNEAGVLTRRQAAEQSFWGRLAYHLFREYGDSVTFLPRIDSETGDFALSCASKRKHLIAELIIPRFRVRKLLSLLNSEFPGQQGLSIHPIPLKSIFRVTPKTKLDIEIRPAIQALQGSGEAKFYEREDFAKFRYGDLVYIKEMNLLAELERPDSQRRFSAPVSMHLEKSQLPDFIDEHRHEIAAGSIVLEGSLQNLSVFREFDRMEISLNAAERSWYWISVHYGFGTSTVSLADILQARREGKSYIQAENGWIDVQAEAFGAADDLLLRNGGSIHGKGVRFSALDLLRLMSSSGKTFEIGGEQQRAKILKRLLALAPAASWNSAKGMSTPLRPYQMKGVDWLRFLFENQLGGLLCDDMGLGKTHQAMALMLWLKRKKFKEPFLVICPTTVISHWQSKIREHVPRLRAVAYHAGNRNIQEMLQNCDVLITSYGILRNDVLVLRDIPFTLVVFDEIQNLKNRETQNHQAACQIQARMRLGLTGTPIENSLAELKSLFDIVLPGYLGSDEEYASRYVRSEKVQELKRAIAPFTLRRIKDDVLEELPDKIEDLRISRLSEMQVKLYREALATKGASLISEIKSSNRRLHYIHIFALLNLLKRICDHPALVLNKVEEYQNYESGKWDLFQELLFETLDSGQKIVVFTQYLGMIRMMEQLMQTLRIGFVTLTGASQERGEIILRFNEDRNCRVFLGSLKAGGTGIDLIGGSTVLHYDRWWNAAREDQATDRVHRIGQKNVVQVFKLVTEGTLEEKISAIIERKRRLMNTVMQADNPELSKIFTREELIELLSPYRENS
jgi:superfamily II DNA or RNA helicase